MRRSTPLFLAFSIIVSQFYNVSYASVPAKAGAICTKINATTISLGTKLQCVKSGKKLIWKKIPYPTSSSSSSNKTGNQTPSATPSPSPSSPSPTPKPTPTPTPTATPSPSPTIKKISYITPLSPIGPNPITWENIENRSSEISAIAWQSTQDTLKANSSNRASTNIKVIYAPMTEITHYPGFENYLRTGIQLWSRFILPPNSTFLVYSYEEIPWAKSTITKILTDSGMDLNQASQTGENLSHAPYGGPDCGGANAGMITSTQAIGVFALCARNEGTDPYYNGPLQIHEFTHQLQGAQYIGSKLNSQQVLPCWISEGLAHAAGLSAGTSTLDGYLQVRKLQASHPVLNVAGGHSATSVDPSQINFEFMKNFYDESSPPSCFRLPSYSLGYSVGFLTTEALSALGGIESTLLLYSRTANGEAFEEAFKNTYGINWSQAKDILARVIVKEFAAFG